MKQSEFIKNVQTKMLDDYLNGKYEILKDCSPFLDWKLGLLTLEDISPEEMVEIVSDGIDELYEKHPNAIDDVREEELDEEDIWSCYQKFGDDKYLASYLMLMGDEMSEIIGNEKSGE